MSEYMEKHAVSRLIGAPPGYVGYDQGGQLTEAVRRRPYSVILFDEIEKAHPDVFNTLLQLLDDGRLTDGQGRTVDFRNTVVIMTSNVGSQFLHDWTNLEAKDRVMEELRRSFRPEFLNRIDDIVIFHPLGRNEIDTIVDVQLGRLRKLLRDRDLDIELSPEARTFLADQGYDPQYGARPLKRALVRYVQDPLARKLLSGDLHPGDTVLVERGEGPESGQLTFTRKPQQRVAVMS
jgi:ATP-dependent Clp protease ATP-binding subunit ClpB